MYKRVATSYWSLSFLLEPYCVGEYIFDIISNCNNDELIPTATVTVDKVHKIVCLIHF